MTRLKSILTDPETLFATAFGLMIASEVFLIVGGIHGPEQPRKSQHAVPQPSATPPKTF